MKRIRKFIKSQQSDGMVSAAGIKKRNPIAFVLGLSRSGSGKHRNKKRKILENISKTEVD
jgi:hypothetical protein